MEKLEDVYWSTRYASGADFHEPGENLTIRGAPPAPVELIITAGSPEGPDREPLCRIELDPKQPVPVFYRVHAITLDGSAGSPVVAVVFGRAGVEKGEVVAQLWMIDRVPPKVVPCNAEHLDQGAVELITEAFA